MTRRFIRVSSAKRPSANRWTTPSILRIVPVDPEKKSRPYIAMELLKGKTLDEVIRNNRPMPVDAAVTYATRLCDALAYMHRKTIVHRDLKPQNIMICADGSLRIMDFGIAKAAGMRRITFTGFSPAMGTPDYMAPEQVKGAGGAMSGPTFIAWAPSCMRWQPAARRSRGPIHL